MTETLLVTKRNGQQEPLDLDKIHKVLKWAGEGIDDVSISQIEMRSNIQFYNGITTQEIHETLIKSAADLISEEYPNYQYLAAHLAIFQLRKIAYGEYTPPSLYEQIVNMVNKGKYDSQLLEWYSKEKIDYLNTFIKHDRDLTLSYAAVKQMQGKYLVQDRVTREVYETPQFLYMLVAMTLFNDTTGISANDQIQKITDFYHAISTYKISLPTPIMGGLRTPTKQFSSCVLIECDDSLDSINATTSAITKYISNRAGIGINAGHIRAEGSPIRKGDAVHTGCIPFYKLFQAAVKSCSQGALRGGAATLFYPLWHLEVESLLVLKNNRGVEENRVRHLDYGVQLNRLMYTRLLKGENITLFSPSDTPNLYETFFSDQDAFEALYEEYERDPNIRKKSIPAVDLFSLLLQERASTGRIYIQNVDNCNTHSPFNPHKAPVKQSNLCVTGDTKILTKQGYKTIGKIVNTEQEVWNGEKWSKVKVEQTGENQKILKVSTYDFREIYCTPYHKFYTEDNFEEEGREYRASELKQDMVLLKTHYPIIDLENAVDGLLPYNLKNPIPDVRYKLSYRLGWLVECIKRFNQSYDEYSIELIFKKLIQAKAVRELLETMGTTGIISEYFSMDDQNEDSGYRLVIDKDNLYKLYKLGLKVLPDTFKELVNKEFMKERHPLTYSTVYKVEEMVETESTYCVNEPIRHKVIFNGVLTGNCMEIALPTKPLEDINDEDGEIALCTLAAINLGEIDKLEDLELVADLTVQALDAILDYQDYPVKAAMNATMKRRPLGIGVINYAYYLAKHHVKYSDGSANHLTHRLFEALQYYLLKASNRLAIKKGVPEGFSDTRYHDGILPIDNYRKTVDKICDEPLHYDWEKLRMSIIDHGLRNSTLTALMPSETSSQISNATNGIEPPRGFVSVKQSKDGILKQVVPDYLNLKDQYELTWDMPSNKGMLELVSIMQKFVDQSISTNTYYDPSKFKDNKVPMNQLIKDLLFAYKLGVKTLYYHNTRDGSGDQL